MHIHRGSTALAVGIVSALSTTALAQVDTSTTQAQPQAQTELPHHPQVTIHTIAGPKARLKRAPFVDFVSLRMMRKKGLITEAEYTSACRTSGRASGRSARARA